jgi:hydroxymethylbilane synthase
MALKLRIGSRPSRLALAQAETVRRRIVEAAPGAETEIVEIRTSGDRMTTASLARVGGKGLFIRELEQALLERRIDIAVHSMKDLPAVVAPEFRIAAVPGREDVRDALVTRDGASLDALPEGSRLGTSSERRRFQAVRKNSGLRILPLRGNVDTRLRRLADGDFDAIIVAMAALRRLGRLADTAVAPLDEREFIPAGGQAALAIETLSEIAPALERAMVQINDAGARYETAAERAFLAAIGASCATPVGVSAKLKDSRLAIRAILFSGDGSRELGDEIEEPADVDLAPSAAEAIGIRLGERMLARGAARLISND